jgi:hypothetical protein
LFSSVKPGFFLPSYHFGTECRAHQLQRVGVSQLRCRSMEDQ